jgi:hypothetical protein
VVVVGEITIDGLLRLEITMDRFFLHVVAGVLISASPILMADAASTDRNVNTSDNLRKLAKLAENPVAFEKALRGSKGFKPLTYHLHEDLVVCLQDAQKDLDESKIKSHNQLKMCPKERKALSKHLSKEDKARGEKDFATARKIRLENADKRAARRAGASERNAAKEKKQAQKLDMNIKGAAKLRKELNKLSREEIELLISNKEPNQTFDMGLLVYGPYLKYIDSPR